MVQRTSLRASNTVALEPAVESDLDARAAHVTLLAKLRRAAEFHALALAHEVGHLIVEELFDGEAAYRARESRHWTRLKALAADPELPFSAGTLLRSCEVYLLMVRLGVGPEDSRIGLSHFRTVLPLATEAEQVALLGEAADGGWTVRQLEAEVAARRDTPLPRGRRAQHPAARAVRAFSRVVTRDVEEALAAPLDGLDAAAREALCDEVQAALDTLQRLLTHLSPEPEDVDA